MCETAKKAKKLGTPVDQGRQNGPDPVKRFVSLTVSRSSQGAKLVDKATGSAPHLCIYFAKVRQVHKYGAPAPCWRLM